MHLLTTGWRLHCVMYSRVRVHYIRRRMFPNMSVAARAPRMEHHRTNTVTHRHNKWQHFLSWSGCLWDPRFVPKEALIVQCQAVIAVTIVHYTFSWANCAFWLVSWISMCCMGFAVCRSSPLIVAKRLFERTTKAVMPSMKWSLEHPKMAVPKSIFICEHSSQTSTGLSLSTQTLFHGSIGLMCPIVCLHVPYI